MSSSRRRLTALALSMTLLTGCSQAGSWCPPLKEYTDGEKMQLRYEMGILEQAMGMEPFSGEVLKDYVVLREQVKACRD